MTPLAPPPANFAELKLPIYSLRRKAGALVRLARPDPATHDGFRRDARYRFDSPDGSFGVLYAALAFPTAFVESVLRDAPARARAARVTLDYRELAERRVVSFDTSKAARALRLVKLYDQGLAAARTDNRIATVDDYAVTQAWAKALHDHPQQADGVIYVSRFLAPQRAVVLFDRSRGLFKIGTVTALLAHAGLARVLDEFALGVDR